MNSRKWNYRGMTDEKINSRLAAIDIAVARAVRVGKSSVAYNCNAGWQRYWDFSDSIRRYNRVACMPLTQVEKNALSLMR